MSIRPTSFGVGETWTWNIRLRNVANAAVDADSTPTVTVYKNNSATGESVTVTKPSATTGWYQCSFDPAGEAEHDVYSFVENVTIASVAQAPFQWEAVVLASVGAGGLDAAGVRAAVGLASADLDTQLDGIADAVGGTGTGARTVTVTVNDGATALQNAAVRLTEGSSSFKGLTNVSGVVTFNVDDSTYTVGITKGGYSYGGTTLVVDGAEAVTYSMTANSSTPPDDPALCAVTIHLRDQYGNDLVGEPVEITFVRFTTDAAETPPVLSIPPVQTSGAGGLVQVELYRDAVYKVIYGTKPYSRRIDVTVPDAGTYEVEQ